MASPELAEKPHLAQESTTSSAAAAAAAGQEEAPQEPVPEAAQPGAEAEKEVDKDDEEEEEGECGFCLFMKGGGCKDAFEAWMDCVEQSEKERSDMVERCSQVTFNLKNCMDAHADYYGPVLETEKAVSDHAEAAVAAAAGEDKEGEPSAASASSLAEEKKEETASSPPAS